MVDSSKTGLIGLRSIVQFFLVSLILAGCPNLFESDEERVPAAIDSLTVLVGTERLRFDKSEDVFTLTVPSTTRLTDLRFEYDADDGTSVLGLPRSIDRNTGPIDLEVRSRTGESASFTLVVFWEPSSEARIVSFTLPASENQGLETDIDGNIEGRSISIAIQAQQSFDWIPVIAVSPRATVSPPSRERQDYSVPVEYTVRAEDGTEQRYLVTLVEAENGQTPSDGISNPDDDSIQSFTFQPDYNADLTEVIQAEISHNAVSVIVPFGTDLSSLVPSIGVSNGSSVTPSSGSQQNFTEPVEYVVRTRDGNERVYTVTVTSSPPSADTTITFLSLSDGTTSWESTRAENEFSFRVPYGTDLTTAVFDYSIAPGGSIDGLPQSIAGPELETVFLVVAQDGTEQEYRLSVREEQNPDTQILEMILTTDNNPTLSSDIVGEIADDTISFSVPPQEDLTFVPEFSLPSGATIEPSTLVPQDFTDDVRYVVSTQDGSSRSYNVSRAPFEANAIESFKFLAANNPQLSSDIEADISSQTITATLPYGTDTSSLAPTIEVSSMATVSPESDYHNDFLEPATYTVTSESGIESVFVVEVDITSPSDDNSLVAAWIDESQTPPDEPRIDFSLRDDGSWEAVVPYETDPSIISPTIEVHPTATSSVALLESSPWHKAYSVTVRAQDGTENESFLQIHRRPENPQNLTFSRPDAGNLLRLEWTQSDGATSYKIRELTSSGMVTLGTTEETHAIVDSPCGVYRRFYVVAVGDLSVQSFGPSITAASKPPAPSVEASQNHDDSVNISWNAIEGVDRYIVQYRIDETHFGFIDINEQLNWYDTELSIEQSSLEIESDPDSDAAGIYSINDALIRDTVSYGIYSLLVAVNVTAVAGFERSKPGADGLLYQF